MKLLGKVILDDFCNSHADGASQIQAWIAETQEAEWSTPGDIKARYVNASFLSDNRVVFNIRGNKYRLDVKVYYQRQIVIVKRIATHSEYSRWKF
jgi:mRNA interferase HigB